VVNSDGLHNQIEGNVIQSLGRTLHEEVAFDKAHGTSREREGYRSRASTRPRTRSTSCWPTPGQNVRPAAAVSPNAAYGAIGARLRPTPFRPKTRAASARLVDGRAPAVLQTLVAAPFPSHAT
jgi:hypothetical protein